MPAAIATLIADNYNRVLDAVAAAAARAGRSAEEVTLVGVSKYVGPVATAALVEAGCSDLGESRPQQLWEKAAAPELAGTPVRWHQIGHLQRNKATRTVATASMIHTVDSPRLLRAIDSAASAELPAEVLLEVNTSGDAEKHGLTAEEAKELVARLPEFPRCRVSGLMTMAAREGGPAVARANFAALRRLREELQADAPAGVTLPHLSMGMSGDFVEAIAEGATHVRIGSALWEGVRPEDR
ncbi:MAG: YggS family pyridoxal phosphate-dependent enzyme [Planctomycetota bacterium]